MKTLIFGAALLAASLPALAQNISIAVGEPGFFGRINIGDAPPPAVVYERPVVIAQPRYQVAPVYLRVPPFQRAHWARYCAGYGACGVPVYFVTDDWYERVYVPHYREVYVQPRGDWREHEYREHERREWREDHDRGHGEGHGRGHDEGHGHGHGHDRD